MKELRFHGRGGQGTVEACQLLTKALVNKGLYAQFIPSFGVERKGSPVFGFFRIDDKDIRPKTEVYDPDIVVILDETLIDKVDVFRSGKSFVTVIINTGRSANAFKVPAHVKMIATVDATAIALDSIGVGIPNTVMLGALAKVEETIDRLTLSDYVGTRFGKENVLAFNQGYEKVSILVRG